MKWWDDLLHRLRRDGEYRAGRHRSDRRGAGSGSRLHWIWPFGAAVVIATVHVIVMPVTPPLVSDLPAAGEIASREVRAPFTFTAPLLNQDIEMRQLQRVLVEPPVAERDEAQERDAVDGLGRLESLHVELTGLAAMTPHDRLGVLDLRHPEIDLADLEYLDGLPDTTSFFASARAVFLDLLEPGIVDELPPGNYRKVRILNGATETAVDLDDLLLQERVSDALTSHLGERGVDPETAAWGARLLRPLLSPNLVYSPQTTRARRLAARQSVPTEREILQGERLIDRGERVTEQDALVLGTLDAMLTARHAREDDNDIFGRQISRLVLLAGLLLLFGWIMRLLSPGLLDDPRRLVSITVMMVLYLVGSAFVLGRPGLGVFAVPIAWLGVLCAALYRPRAGYAAVALAASLLAFADVATPLAVVSWLATGLVAVTLMRRIRQRDQFYQAIAVLAALGVLLVALLDLSSGELDARIWNRLLVASLTPVASVALALFLLPIVEPLVGVSSDLTLLELSDLNHPLLKKMALECQGTFHHSQVVGQLAEHAARSIGANSLLTRVGALFHDIGKMSKPEYYVENQGGGPNKHDELSPSMSALVVSSHVKDGMELGRKWRLPEVVIDFIPEHHGTHVMKFFYHKALESGVNETVKVDDYRYPGPKPRSRETAILMLADASEAATRSLTKPTPGRIREMVKQIFDERMLSGELDECGLTLRDLADIRDAFIPLLTSIHHARIAYPGQVERPTTEVRA